MLISNLSEDLLCKLKGQTLMSIQWLFGNCIQKKTLQHECSKYYQPHKYITHTSSKSTQELMNISIIIRNINFDLKLQ